MTNPRLPLIAAISIAALISACQKPQEPTGNEMAAANDTGAMNEAAQGAAMQPAQLLDGAGKAIGQVEMSEDPNGVTLKVAAAGLPAGTHGVHLHEKGMCEGPKFESAGAHWNPTSKQHGRDNPMGAHLGDLANMEAADGTEASSTYLVAGVTMGGTQNALADADGTSLVVHAKADDYKTDPSGNSGDRIACAVIAPPMGG
jgi:superoxide dismutase, Cu-Zn family